MAPTARLTPDVLDRLRRIVGTENVKTGAAAVEVYSYDAILRAPEPPLWQPPAPPA